MLVDVVEDDFDNLVVAWEDFRIAGHGVSVDTGKIHLNRYRYKNGGLHVLEEMTFEGTSSNQVVRRPNLATSHYDQVNSVSLAFAELYDFPTSDAVATMLKLALIFSASSLVCLPFVVASGVCRLKGGSIKKHRWSVVCFVGLVLASVATAAWMFVDAVPFE